MRHKRPSFRSDQWLSNGGFLGRLQPGEDRPPGRRRLQVEVPQFLHELGPQLRASVLKDFRAYGELFRRGCVTQAPTAHVGQQGHQSDGCFGQAANDLLLVAGIVATGYQSGFLQARQPVGQNVRGYPLLRPGSIAI